jgi:hypothetical protein
VFSVLAMGTASADEHEHHHHAPEPQLGAHHAAGSAIEASLGLVLANYDARLFSGEYQGAFVGAGWSHDRFAIAVKLATYRLQKNGKTVTGRDRARGLVVAAPLRPIAEERLAVG